MSPNYQSINLNKKIPTEAVIKQNMLFQYLKKLLSSNPN